MLDGNIEDLRVLMRDRVSASFGNFVERLIDTGPDGFQTAFTARRAVLPFAGVTGS